MTTTIDPFTARAAAKMRHPAGTQLDGEKLSPADRNVLLHALAERRTKLTARRKALASELRQIASELGTIDHQLDDIEQSETWLLS